MICMINEVFASDETVALAKEKACKMLGVTEDKVDFEIRQFPSKKVLGMFGGKLAQVRAVLKKNEAQKAAEFLKEVLYYMGLGELNVEILNYTPEECELKITGDDVGYIIGRHADTLDALQYVATLVSNKKAADEPFCKVRLEAGDYRKKRKEVLEKLSRNLAQKAVKTGKKLILEPMRAYERKIIHTEIGNFEGVKSWSEGENYNRHVVISAISKE